MIYAVGDVHGMHDKLDRLLTVTEDMMTPEDQLVFLGDYIDRGPDSNKVLDTLLYLKERKPNTIFLKGNHEEMFLDFLVRLTAAIEFKTESIYDAFQGQEFYNWWQNGGKATANSYVNTSNNWESFLTEMPAKHTNFLTDYLQHTYVIGNYIFVHGMLYPQWVDEPEKPRPMKVFISNDSRLWIRIKDMDLHSQMELVDIPKTIVYGHTPTNDNKPRIFGNTVGIDTGSCFKGKLTVAAFDPEKKFDKNDLKYWQF